MRKKIRGAGGGGGSSSQPTQRSAVVAPDSLVSKQFARVLDLIGEGEIEGLVDGYKSIYLDGTPMQNPDGSDNFSGFTVEMRNGAQDQDHIAGFPATESATSVSVEVRSGQPVVRQISNPNIDAVRVSVAVPQLYAQDPSSGDVSGSYVGVKIEVQPNGGNYTEAVLDGISGKCTSRYSRNYRVELFGAGPWNIRVSKTTADSDANTKRDLYWAMTTEIIDAKLSYQNSAIVGITIDSSQFANIPTRAYDIKGLRVKVPTNYDPETRTYSGLWNGTFKIAWTDNPAWCFYDLLTNERYGLGEFVTPAQVDKANLYTIGQYCDELVPDGFGGLEPRFACNLYLQTREQAFRVLSDMVSIFAGMLFWASGGLSCTQDAPDDPLYQFTNGNVIDGEFTYSGSSRNVRHTTALVSYNDPTDKFIRKVEYVEDAEGIQKYGIRQAETVAIGCTSRGQAHRLGKRILLTERYLTEVVNFKTGLEGTVPYPGAVIKVMDNNRAGARMGGRVRSATLNTITLDSAVEIDAEESYILTIIKPDGTLEERGIVNVAGQRQTLTLTTDFSTIPGAQSVWVLTCASLDAQLFKVVSVKELDGMIYEVNALAYNPSKYAAIEQNLAFDPLDTSLLPGRLGTAIPAAPTGLSLTTATYTDTTGNQGVELLIGWESGSPSFEIAWREDAGNWHTDTRYLNSTTVRPARIGSEYEVTVYAVNRYGWRSATAATGLLAVTEDALPPRTVLASLLASPDFLGVSIVASASSQLRRKDTIEIFESLTNNRNAAYPLCVMHQPIAPFARTGMDVNETRYYWGRVVNSAGLVGDWYPAGLNAGVPGQSSSDAEWLTDRLFGKLGEPQLATGLASRIDLLDTAGPPDMPGGIIARIRAQQGEMRTINNSADLMGQRLLESALKIQENTALLFDAGVNVSPETGEVTIYGVEQAKERLNAAEIRLNAAESSLTLKATSNYVDEQIALAVLDPSQIANLSGVTARLNSAEVGISGLNAAVSSKAEAITVNDQGVRISTAENEIDALQSQITSKVENATFTAVESRVSGAEQQITALEGSGILQTVSDVRSLKKQADVDAETLLRNVLTGKENADQAAQSLALASTELRAYVDDGLSAEAVSRTALATQVAENAATLALEYATKTSVTEAVTTASQTLTSAFGAADAAVLAAAGAAATVAMQNYAHAKGVTYTRAEANQAIAASSQELAAAYTAADAATLAAAGAAADAKVSNYAYAKADTYTKAEANSAISASSQTLQARLDTGDFATVKQESSASAGRLNGVEAKWSVKAQTMADGVTAVAGIELISGESGETAFAVLADKFLVYKPDGSGVPIQMMAIGTVNGVNALGFNGSLLIDGSIAGRSINVDSLVARLAEITTAYIGTANIAEAAVKTANIGDLAVNSIKIAGRSVTTCQTLAHSFPPRGIVGPGSGEPYSVAVSTPDLYAHLDQTPQAVIVFFSLQIVSCSNSSLGAYSPGWITAFLTKNGAVIGEPIRATISASALGGGYFRCQNQGGVVSGFFIDPAPGLNPRYGMYSPDYQSGFGTADNSSSTFEHGMLLTATAKVSVLTTIK